VVCVALQNCASSNQLVALRVPPPATPSTTRATPHSGKLSERQTPSKFVLVGPGPPTLQSPARSLTPLHPPDENWFDSSTEAAAGAWQNQPIANRPLAFQSRGAPTSATCLPNRSLPRLDGSNCRARLSPTVTSGVAAAFGEAYHRILLFPCSFQSISGQVFIDAAHHLRHPVECAGHIPAAC